MKSRKSRSSTSKTAANRKSQRRSLPIFEGLDSRTLMSVAFAPSVNYAVSSSPRSVAVGDFNADGRQDLASPGYAGNNLSVLLGNGDGTFQPRADYFIGFGGARSVALGDFNADGRQDVVVPAGSDHQFAIFIGNGDGTFQGTRIHGGRAASHVAVADLNADGKLDLAMAHSDSVSALLGNGNGTFQAGVHYSVGDYANAVTIADINADGRQDLAAVLGDTGWVSLLIGNGNGTFQTPYAYSAGVMPFAVVARDLNGDGLRDLVTSNQNGDNVSVLRGFGGGIYHPAVQYAAFDAPRSLVVEDFDLDGKLDLATANVNSSNVGILAGNGDCTFQSAAGFVVGGNPFSVASGDFNGDGKPDVVTANITTSTLGVLLNRFGLNMPPMITRNLAAVTVNEGSPATNTGTFDDPQGRNTVTLSASLGTVTKNDATGAWNWSYTPVDNMPSTPVTITATDTEGDTATATFNLTANNIAPTITALIVPSTGNEGAPVSLSAAATDPAGANDPLTFTWTITRSGGPTTTLTGPNPTFTPADNAGYVVNLAVSDGDGGTHTGFGQMVVANIAPTATFAGPSFGLTNQSLSFTASATDPSSTDQSAGFEYRITWGDGSADTITRTPGNGNGVNFTHAYTGFDTYTATLTVIDKDNGFGFATRTITVSTIFGAFFVDEPKPTVTISFPMDMAAASIAAGDLTLVNQTTGQSTNTATQSTVTYNANTRTAIWRFPNLLADGDYLATLPAGAVNDASGNPVPMAHSVDFFAMAGDASRDRIVDIGDFSIIAARFNLPGTFSRGDFNYDGIADIGDFAILASKFNTSLPAARAMPAASSSGTDLTNLPSASAPDIVLGLDAIEDVDELTALVQ